jgi:hypothetical protein
MLKALRWIGKHGIPTGGSGDGTYTCVPNFANGAKLEESRKHVVQIGDQTVLKPPGCPTKCTNPDYPRTLQEDIFKPEGFTESWQTTVFESATRAIALHGPVLINIQVYKSFLDYKEGVYSKKADDEFLYYHVVLAIGYGHDYVTAMNSWGTSWGNDGYFNIYRDLVEYYVVPGEIHGHGEGYPFPIPSAPMSTNLQMEGFALEALNDRFTEVEEKVVNGKETYWNDASTFFTYYCEGRAAWAITAADNFDSLQTDGSRCFFHALQRASMCQGHVTLSRRTCEWYQYDATAGDLVECPKCGLKHIFKV